jgi:hypothetical protein
MQLVVVQELKLAIQLVLRVIAVAPLHPMVAQVQPVQLLPQHQLQILALVAEALVGQQALIWLAETAPPESSSFDMQCQLLPLQHPLLD